MIGNFLYKIMRVFVQFFFSCKYRIKIHNKDNLPYRKKKGDANRIRGGYIIACNHQSYSDPPVIAAVVKGRFSFMAKKELFGKNPFFTLIIRMCGAFPVARGAGDNSAIERSVSDLKKGKVFVIFPEGTRSKDGTIGRAKSGAALIASMANAPVLPVCIMYGQRGKRSLDFAVGEMIPAEEICTNPVSVQGAPPAIDRKELRRISELIINDIKQLQQQILNERI